MKTQTHTHTQAMLFLSNKQSAHKSMLWKKEVPIKEHLQSVPGSFVFLYESNTQVFSTRPPSLKPAFDLRFIPA